MISTSIPPSNHRYRIEWLFLAVTGLALLADAGYSHLVEEFRAQIFGALALAACCGLLFYQHRQRAFDALSGSQQHILATSEARFRCLTEMSSDFYWETDAEHRFTERTESKREAADPVFQRASFIGLRRWEVPHLSPDAAGWQAHRALLEAHIPFRGFEISRAGADDAVHHLYVSGDPVFDAGGKFTGYRGMGKDITDKKQALSAAKASEAFSLAVLNSVAASIAVVNRQGVILAVNAPWLAFALENGIEPGKPAPHTQVGSNYFSVCGGDGESGDRDSSATRSGIQAVMDGSRPDFCLEYPCHSPSKERWFMMSVQPFGPEAGLGVAITHTDITAVKQNEDQLRIAAATFESQECTMVTNSSGIILKVNKALTAATGYTTEEILGHTPSLFRSGRHDADFYRAMWATITRTGSWQGEIWDRRKNGEVYPKWLTISAVKDEAGVVTNYVGTHFDISALKKAEERIEHLAFFDQLTGLPNRTLLLDRLKQARATSSRNESRGAVLLIDLDNFKTVNDTLGHDVGDQLLKQAAQRLKQCVRTGDTVARLGGDEFVVMLANLSANKLDAATSTETVAEKIIDMLGDDYQLDNLTVQGTASIGIIMFNGQHATIDDLMKQAELAMYQAKDAGRNAFRFFDPVMESAVKERTLLEQDLRRALEQKEFLLHYQPQVGREGRVTGAEVLVRWQHPQRGMVSPDDFIPLAEDTGLILPLGHWVMETACFQLARWATRPETAHLTLAVNVSARQFRQADFVQQVLAILEHSGANPQQLKLELTESMLVENVEEIIGKMLELKASGVSFSLDDFGTGYSSLSYLSRLPLDQLKIDRSFVSNIERNVNDAVICAATISLGHSLRLKVVAEGVETEAQRYFLNTVHHCDFIQGYLYSRPLPLEDFETFVVAHPGPDLKTGLRLVSATGQRTKNENHHAGG
jgi:diguanylate cyclase (GGDEF)-like protein/PAS domain S-box-containing protein